MPKRGKLVVIEGTDGSGKSTQSELLAERLKKEGYSVKAINFPQYGKRSARLVEDYLAGKFGRAEDVSPYDASKYYAEDRKEAAPQIKKWLEEGNIVIANRYQQSNKGHQASKIKDLAERKKFMEWIDNLEYNQNKIPKADKVIFLHVPAEMAQSLVTARGNKKDIHEASIEHLKSTEKVYMEIAEKEGWIIIECVKKGSLMPKEEIHDILWGKIKGLLK